MHGCPDQRNMGEEEGGLVYIHSVYIYIYIYILVANLCYAREPPCLCDRLK